MRAAKIPRYVGIDGVQEQERDGFFHCGERTTVGNHRDIQRPIIDIGLGRKIDGTGVATRIVDDNLPGLPLPEQVASASSVERADSTGKGRCRGNSFSPATSKAILLALYLSGLLM
jgi:hypothetical protein